VAKPELYVSVDVEADGRIPGPNSMLSFGAACFSEAGQLVGTFTRNLETLPGARGDPDTMRWWATQPEAWDACRQDLVDPAQAMAEFQAFLEEQRAEQDATLVFVGFPASYDFMFVYWYLIEFTGESPFSFSALDIKTYAAAVLKKGYRSCSKRGLPKRWFQGTEAHTHQALDDAIGQGQLFMNIRREHLGRG